MKKIISMMLLLLTAASIITTGKEADAASFRGNLNATYKSSEGKITIKKVSGKKVKVTIKTEDGSNKVTGKIKGADKVTFNMSFEGVTVTLKWKNKNMFSTSVSGTALHVSPTLIAVDNGLTYKKQGGSSSSSSSIPKSVIGTYTGGKGKKQVDICLTKVKGNKVEMIIHMDKFAADASGNFTTYYKKNGYKTSFPTAKKSGNKYAVSSGSSKFQFTISGKTLKLKETKAPKGKKVLPKTFKKTSNEWYND